MGNHVAAHARAAEAIALLGERFGDAGQDGPSAYASFLGIRGDEEEGPGTVRAFLGGFREAR